MKTIVFGHGLRARKGEHELDIHDFDPWDAGPACDAWLAGRKDIIATNCEAFISRALWRNTEGKIDALCLQYVPAEGDPVAIDMVDGEPSWWPDGVLFDGRLIERLALERRAEVRRVDDNKDEEDEGE